MTRTAATGAGRRRVGELAAATGLTIRTLHHYEEVGLLVASDRSPAGHRLYSDADVERLYRICLLRRLGLGLSETARALDDPAWGLRAAVRAHLDELERRAEQEAVLRLRLSRLLDASGAPGVDLVHILEEMTMLDATVQKRISILVYADLDAAHEQLVRAFGLGPGEVTREEDGRAIHAELQAGDGVLWLHQESEAFGLASPRTLGATTGSVAVMVDDVDAHCAHARAEGVEVVYEPVDQPYGYREYGARDGEGHLWSFMTPLD